MPPTAVDQRCLILTEEGYLGRDPVTGNIVLDAPAHEAIFYPPGDAAKLVSAANDVTNLGWLVVPLELEEL